MLTICILVGISMKKITYQFYRIALSHIENFKPKSNYLKFYQTPNSLQMYARGTVFLTQAKYFRNPKYILSICSSLQKPHTSHAYVKIGTCEQISSLDLTLKSNNSVRVHCCNDNQMTLIEI